jgi:hypothetical protein
MYTLGGVFIHRKVFSGVHTVSYCGRVPNQPKTPIRGIRVPDGLWNAAQDRARIEGTNVSAVINAFLRDWTGWGEDDQREADQTAR